MSCNSSVHSGVISSSKPVGNETYAELPVDPPVNQREVLSQVSGNLYKDFAEARDSLSALQPYYSIAWIFRSWSPARAATLGKRRTVLSCDLRPRAPAGLWAGERTLKSTSCNISLGVSMRLPKNPPELSLRDGTLCYSPSLWLPEGGGKEVPWFLLCSWERTWSDCPSALRMAQGRANPWSAPPPSLLRLPGPRRSHPAIKIKKKTQQNASVLQRGIGSLSCFRRKYSVWYPGCDTDLRGSRTYTVTVKW